MATSVSKSVSKSRSSAISWTLNNYTNDDIDNAKSYIKDQCLYGCFSQEVGESGTPHLQGYVYFENARSYPNKKFRKVFNERVHDAMSYSSPHSNRNYCLGMVEKKGNKENPTFWEYGECPNQGSRVDYAKALVDLKQKDVTDVIDEQPHLLPMINALTRYKQAYRKSTHRDVRVVALIGKTRTGKSRSAWEAYPDLYRKPRGQYWGFYNGQETVLLDDFAGDLPLDDLLQVLDRYPLDLPVKGSYTPALYVNVIITSNLQPRQWYPGALPEQLDALEARMRIVRKIIYTQQDVLDHTHAIQNQQESSSSSQEVQIPTAQEADATQTHAEGQ